MADLLNASDLEAAKKHNTFHNEAITGKVGGLSTGANIDYATNAVTGQVQKTLPATIDGLDWSYVGKFADGVTFTKKSDFALDSDGTQWIYTGSLPFSATAGTVPSEPTYQAVHVKSASAISNANGGTVQDFIDGISPSNSTQLVGGVAASYLNVLSKKNGIDDYTIINPDVQKVASNIMSITQTLKCVITGDSLSFNGFDYDEFTVDGGGYATNQPFGMSSWSHLLRDLWFTSNGGFTGIQDLKIVGTATRSFPTSPTNYENLGINAKAAFYNFASTGQSITVSSNYPGNTHLVISYAPAADAVLFDVDGVEYDNTTPNGNYHGYGYMLVPTGLPNSVVNNVRKKSDGSAGGFWLYGISARDTVTPQITGKGAWTSGQILAEYADLVTPYSPDVIYYIIGANDIVAAVPLETFRSNLQSFINNARTAKPDCVIVLLSSVPSSTASLNRATTKTYIKVMYEVAVLNDCSLIDMYSKLEQIDPTYWRFDNIHFKNSGNDIVFNIIKELTIPSVAIKPDVFYPSRATYLGVNGAFMTSRFAEETAKAQTVVVQFSAGSPTVLTGGSSSEVFADSLTLSYVADGGFDKARVVCPSTHAVGTISDIIIVEDFTERVVGRLITGKISMDFARVNSSGRQTIAGSNLYAVIMFVPV